MAVSVSPAQVAIDSYALLSVHGAHLDSCVELKGPGGVLGQPCTIVVIEDTLAVFSCFVHDDAELSIFCNDRNIFLCKNIAVKSPFITSLVPLGVFLGYNRFQIMLSNAMLNPIITLNNNSCSFVVSNLVSLIATCHVQEIHVTNQLVVKIENSNIPPIVTVLRSEGLFVSSIFPLVFTISEVKDISVHGIFPDIDVLASCWFGSIRSFLRVNSSSLASCEVPGGMFGNITVSITEDSSHLPSRDFLF
jgi:hypothetical protein